MVRSGLAGAGDFRLLLGLAGWAPGQLAGEVASGVWYCAAASRGVIMPPEGPDAAHPDAMRRRVLSLIGRQHRGHQRSSR
ncbi:hypothetical protein Rsub_12871 [Raphidocelis subcapitata]|uniref:Transcriptional regulator n=1 Tax=Raphidocelis subcapitata TaxID=307507 RepID=A0A2V0PRW6_9CHLO|nr:hypothetical protein Rsub_12871 [Raphidocelis subcapitata]|eukprot:GBG00046.1 hypothetical protein Rsub_12871 [Raphidocelis subcapitata]